MRYWLILLCLLSSSAFAATAMPCAQDENCVTEQKLYLNLALGYGQRSNPLYDGDELPLILMPDVYYYGDHWFFDNGKLGSNWSLSEQWQLSVVGQFNQEKGYFQKWFGGNAFQFRQSFANSGVIGDDEEKVGPVLASVRETRKRPTAFDLGLQLDWFGEQWHVQSIVWQDASNTYQGQHATIGAGRSWHTLTGTWQFGARLHWKSAKLIDTYYGIDNNEAFYLNRYQGGPSWQPELRLGWQYPLSERVAVLALLRYLHLDDAMTDSPLVRTDHVKTWFFGISYRLF